MEAAMEVDVVDLADDHVPFIGDCTGCGLCPCTECNVPSLEDEEDGDLSRDTKAARTKGGARTKKNTLEKLRARLQIPLEGHFDRTDIAWEGRTNQGRGRFRETFRAIIPWDRLGDFVEGEQSMRDFPCTFNEVPTVGHKLGQAENAKETSFLQKTR